MALPAEIIEHCLRLMCVQQHQCVVQDICAKVEKSVFEPGRAWLKRKGHNWSRTIVHFSLDGSYTGYEWCTSRTDWGSFTRHAIADCVELYVPETYQVYCYKNSSYVISNLCVRYTPQSEVTCRYH